nr:MAG TPA: baseplate protein [Caudoviricetes sp.]
MANKIFNTRIKNKRDTEANWTSKNPVLLNGEIIVVDTASGETRFKVGDGAKKYSQLPFQDAATLGNYVPTTRKVNSKALSSDISLTASDVGALPSTTTALKNPHALTFTGAVTGSYDGSAAKSVAIPSVDSSLSSTSTNAIQNKAVNTALSGKASTAVATTSANGLMSSSDKSKLDGIADGANKTIIDSSLSSTSTNPVQNKVINTALSGKASTSVATTSANGLMSASDKTKLNGIATGANKTTVDSALSTTSTNPVQNKAVKAALDSKLNTSGGTLTGNLTGRNLTGTWLQTTDVTDLGSTPSKIAVLDGSGWVYYRTPTEIKTDIGVDVSSLVDLFYPIGSIYMSTDSTSPQSRFTGTYWLPIYDRFLLGAGNAYKARAKGGEATHTLTQQEIPSHYHDEYVGNDGGPDSAPSGYSGWPNVAYIGKKTWWAKGAKTSDAGGDGAHNNMPPYYTVYMWRRVTFQEYEAGADGG